MIDVGDEVVCIRPAGVDDDLRPAIRPVLGEVYTVTSIYPMKYGLGCTLEGLDPRPYRGYLLYVCRVLKNTDMQVGWYFEKLVKLDIKKMADAELDNELIGLAMGYDRYGRI